MKDYRYFLSYEYLLIKINNLMNTLDGFPKLKEVTRGNKGNSYKVIREYDKTDLKVLHEYHLNSNNGQKLQRIYNEREQIAIKLKEYRNIWQAKYNRPVPILDERMLNTLQNLPVQFGNSMEFYRQLVPEMGRLKYGNRHPYTFRNVPMTSKVEVDVASVFYSLDLDYKYEPEISLGNELKVTDFFVCIPMINSCFPTEVAGLMDKDRYYAKLMGDLTIYFKCNYVMDRSLLVIAETEELSMNTDVFAVVICSFVNQFLMEVLLRQGITID